MHISIQIFQELIYYKAWLIFYPPNVVVTLDILIFLSLFGLFVNIYPSNSSCWSILAGHFEFFVHVSPLVLIYFKYSLIVEVQSWKKIEVKAYMHVPGLIKFLLPAPMCVLSSAQQNFMEFTLPTALLYDLKYIYSSPTYCCFSFYLTLLVYTFNTYSYVFCPRYFLST